MRKAGLGVFTALLLAGFGLAGMARAETVTAEWVGGIPPNLASGAGADIYYSGDGGVLDTGGNAYVGDMQWQGESTNASPFNGTFYAFCIDVFDGVNLNTEYNFNVSTNLANAPQPSAGGPMGAFKAKEIESLYGNFYSALSSDSSFQAFQLAVWNIIYDADQSVSPGAGDFYVLNDGTYDFGNISAAIPIANGYLATAFDDATNNTGAFETVYNILEPNPDGSAQSLLVPGGSFGNGTPLPSAALGGGVLILGMALVHGIRRVKTVL